MHSLWWQMVLRWLGGEGPEALADDSDLTDRLLSEAAAPVFRVVRDPHTRLPVRPAARAPDAPDAEDLIPSESHRS